MIQAFVQEALAEDLGRGDLFARVAPSQKASAYLTCKDEGVFAGAPYAQALCELLHIQLTLHVKDGERLQKGQLLGVLEGESLALLQAERTLLNLLQHASGIATKVARYVQALEGLHVRLLDTRKTRPLLRTFEKYAVRCGGGSNHRFGLDDALMLKDTHLALLGDVKAFMATARKALPFTCKVEIECESLEGAQEAMGAGADVVMCDNMSLAQMSAVVAFRNAHFPHVLLEASGNITEQTIKEVAQTGVDAISSGSLIHQATWLDFSMKMNPLR
jgi:nicotinate-nucleotide pyrophosphorylase (carboxylating)